MARLYLGIATFALYVLVGLLLAVAAIGIIGWAGSP
jgi:hypothetical protein